MIGTREALKKVILDDVAGFPMRAIVLLSGILVLSIRPAFAGDQMTPTLIVSGDRVWTGDPERPWVEAIAVGKERIVAVGRRDEIAPLATTGTKTIDAGSGLVVPGWIDSHIHLFQGGRHLHSVQLRDATSREEFVARIRRCASTVPRGQWILGGDWDHTMWGGELPHRDWIDAVTTDHPVWIRRLDGHMALANSLALKKAGIGATAEAPSGGAIERDDQGRITGLLRDNAMQLVERAVPSPTASQMLEALDAASSYLLANGVTSVCHLGSLDELRLLRAARANNRLQIRVYAATPLSQWESLADEIEQHGRGDEWLTAGGLKGFVDGSLGSHTAALLKPYSDSPSDRGLIVNSMDDLYAWTSGADQAGLQVAVHAIGDRAIRLQLDLFEAVIAKNGDRDRRFRIEHAQHIHPKDLPRFAELNVIASMQPYHAIDDGRWAEALIGPERSATTYAFRSLIDSGARLAFGSDWFVAPATPLEGIYAAVTRRTLDGKHPQGWIPEQSITVEEALHAYTMGAAYAVFAESVKGSLAVGKVADMVVLDADITRMEQSKIRDAKVCYTIVGGRIAYDHEETSAGIPSDARTSE